MKEKDDRPWVTIYDQWGDATGSLAGSREGLEKLKETIDEALLNGEVKIGDDLRGDFQDVKVVDIYPEDEEETPTQKWISRGCLTGIAMGLGIFLFGCYALFKLIYEK